MMFFWAIIFLMSALALAFVLPPLIRSSVKQGPSREDISIEVYRRQREELETEFDNKTIDQEQFEQAKLELEKGLVQDLPNTEPEQVENTAVQYHERLTGIIIGITLPVAAVLIYLGLGSINTIEQSTASTPALKDNSQLPSVNKLVEKLVKRLETQPDDGKGWMMLGRSYAAMNRYQEASMALARAHKILGDEPTLLSEYAEVLAAANNNQLTGKPVQLINKALELDPNHQKALWLAGHAAAEAGNRQQAANYWSRLLKILPPESEAAITVKQYIAHATGKTTEPTPPGASTKTSDSIASIQVKVTLDKTLRSKVSPEDTVFIFAKAAEGPKMPLAIVRKQVKDLPVTVTLDDSMAMMSTMTLSQFPKVIIGARVSPSGNAIAQPGDLQGLSNPISPTSTTSTQIVISGTVP